MLEARAGLPCAEHSLAVWGLRTSVTATRLLHRSRLPFPLRFRAMWCVPSHKREVTALGLQRLLGHGSYRNAWPWTHMLHRARALPALELSHMLKTHLSKGLWPSQPWRPHGRHNARRPRCRSVMGMIDRDCTSGMSLGQLDEQMEDLPCRRAHPGRIP